MIIEKNNYVQSLKHIYIHDSHIKDLQINYGKHTINLLLYNNWLKKQFNFEFIEVFHLEFTQLGCWGESEDILDVDINLVAKDFFLKPNDKNASRLLDFDPNSILQCSFEFASGDNLNIICTTIFYEEIRLNKLS